MLGGMAYASIPAILKVKTGAHEVVTTIMLNGIAVSLVAWASSGSAAVHRRGGHLNVNLRTDPFRDNARDPRPRPPLRDPHERPSVVGAPDGARRWRRSCGSS